MTVPSTSVALRCLLVLQLTIGFAGIAWGQGGAQPQLIATEPRIALIIANSNYASAKDRLGGPASDAGVINKVLRQRGFRGIDGASSPTVVHDQNLAQIKAAILTFRETLRKAGPLAVGVFYYAGHGASGYDRSENFMLPVDVVDASNVDPGKVGYSINDIVDLFSYGDVQSRPTVVIIFDACRSVGVNGISRKQSVVPPATQQPERVLVALSTGASQVASDDGRYAEVLAAKMGISGLTIGEMFDQVKLEVAAKSDNKQIPVYQSGISRPLCIASCNAAIGSDPLAKLEFAMRNRPMADLGQVAAVQELVAKGHGISGLDMMGIGLEGAKIDGADMRRSKFDGVDLSGSSMARAKLDESQFNLANLLGVQLQAASAEGALFQFSKVDNGNLGAIRASRANFLGASLKKVNFKGADLRGASFMLADVRDADFSDADLTDAVFVGALLEGARFDRAKVTNLDVTSAVGKANLFSVQQQAGLCASETDGRFRFELNRLIKVPEGYDLRTDFTQVVKLWPSLQFFDPCVARAIVSAKSNVWSDRAGVSHVSGELQLRYLTEFMQAGNRADLFEQRAAEALNSFVLAQNSGPHLQVVGRQKKTLLIAMQQNLLKDKLEPSLVVIENESFLLYMLKHGQNIFNEDDWGKWARWQVEREARYPKGPKASDRQEAGLQWPALFPPGTRPSMLAPEHVEVFRLWTLRRARNMPDIAEAYGVGGIKGLSELIRKAAEDAPQATAQLSVHPAESNFTEVANDSRRLAFQQALGRQLIFPGTMSNSGICQWSVVRMPESILNVGVSFPRTAVDALRYADPSISFSLRVIGASVKKVGDSTVCILDTRPSTLHLQGHNVTFSSRVVN